jgi:hypothetical protein
MTKVKLMTALILMACLSLGYAYNKAAVPIVPEEIPRITKEELKIKLASEDIIIIDVRIPSDYDKNDEKIPGAIRENPMDVRYWTPYPKDKTIVLYCA